MIILHGSDHRNHYRVLQIEQSFRVVPVFGVAPTKKDMPPLPSREKRRQRLLRMSFSHFRPVEEQVQALLDAEEREHDIERLAWSRVRSKVVLEDGQVFYFQQEPQSLHKQCNNQSPR